MSSGFFPTRTTLSLTHLHSGLITATHILHAHSILSSSSHISVRNPDNPKTFFMSRSLAPPLLRTASDIVEYRIEDGEAVEEGVERGFEERRVHAEVYAKFEGVRCVVYARCADVVPFAQEEGMVKAVMREAEFLGPSVPIWPSSSSSSSLPTTTPLAHDLAAALHPSTSTSFLLNQVRSALPSLPSLGMASSSKEPSNPLTSKPSSSAEAALAPLHPVLLLRGIGFVSVAGGIEEAVYQAIYTRLNCIAQLQCSTLNTVSSLSHGSKERKVEGKVEGKIDIEGGGKLSAKIREGRVLGVDEKGEEGGVKGLVVEGKKKGDEKEAERAKEEVKREWEGWVWSVTREGSGYVNACEVD